MTPVIRAGLSPARTGPGAPGPALTYQTVTVA